MVNFANLLTFAAGASAAHVVATGAPQSHQAKFAGIMNNTPGNITSQPTRTLLARQGEGNSVTVHGNPGTFTSPASGTVMVNTVTDNKGNSYVFPMTVNSDSPNLNVNSTSASGGRVFTSYQNPVRSNGEYGNPIVGFQNVGPEGSASTAVLGQQYDFRDNAGTLSILQSGLPNVTPAYAASNVEATQGADGKMTSVTPSSYSSVSATPGATGAASSAASTTAAKTTNAASGLTTVTTSPGLTTTTEGNASKSSSKAGEETVVESIGPSTTVFSTDAAKGAAATHPANLGVQLAALGLAALAF